MSESTFDASTITFHLHFTIHADVQGQAELFCDVFSVY